MLQRSSEEKESERASMVAWRSGDGGGVSPPASFEDSFARSISFSSLFSFTLSSSFPPVVCNSQIITSPGISPNIILSSPSLA